MKKFGSSIYCFITKIKITLTRYNAAQKHCEMCHTLSISNSSNLYWLIIKFFLRFDFRAVPPDVERSIGSKFILS